MSPAFSRKQTFPSLSPAYTRTGRTTLISSVQRMRLPVWPSAVPRDVLAPADLADPHLLTESREALDELTAILDLGGDFYPFQR